MVKDILTVSGMSCAHCEKAVTEALTDIGAAEVKADAKAGTVTVLYDESAVSIDAIKAAIEETGYEVQ